MAQPFLGEISPVAFPFPPKGWAFCNGQILSIQQNTALFSLLGTTYGGDGVNTFALPDLRGRVSVSSGPNYPLGSTGGVEGVTLNGNQIPAHSHAPVCSTQAGTIGEPASQVWAGSSSGEKLYQTGIQSQRIDGLRPDHSERKLAAPYQPPAVSRRQFHHRASGRLPFSKLIS